MQVQGLPVLPPVRMWISGDLARHALVSNDSMVLVVIVTLLIPLAPVGCAAVAVRSDCGGRSRRRRGRAQELLEGYLAGFLKPRPAHRVGHPATNRH